MFCSESKKVKESEVAIKSEDSKDEELESKTSSRNSKLKSDKKVKDGKGKSVASLSKRSVHHDSSSPPSSVQSAEKEDTNMIHANDGKETKQTAESSPQHSSSPIGGGHKSPVVERKGSLTSSEDGHSRKTSVDETEVPPVMETPQSPPPRDQPPKKMSSVQVESDWSSGDEFKSCDNGDRISEETVSVSKRKEDSRDRRPEQPVDYRKNQETLDEDKVFRTSPRDPRTPSDNEQGDRGSGRVAARPSKHLPRRYQVESEPQEMSRKEQYRPREPRMEKRYMVGPTSPSPPPGFHRRRAPPEQFDRSRHRRPHAFSPGPPRGHRRHSRSPQRYQSPGYKKTPSPRLEQCYYHVHFS